jgi:hypothetical protein
MGEIGIDLSDQHSKRSGLHGADISTMRLSSAAVPKTTAPLSMPTLAMCIAGF